ncbi:bifunctional diaminohydroxyphosphoribosylaminopyrimidine deaminase/5-amino-6-(5-phosphoribosylamino)uracil reductase RibD [Bacillaceae bacterium W0354]
MNNSTFYMRHALQLASLTIGQTSPNPSVGAVIVKDGIVVGTGTHLIPGEAHAEVHAINQAGELAKGADMYVTLEPCSHYGKTPPCAKAIIEAGIKKVYVASLDSNPKVAGKGVEWLRSEGIDVEVGILEDEALEINQAFFYFHRYKRPFITLKAAVSLDGKMTANSGDSKWITSDESRLDVHINRHKHDAILVGSETILKDDPLLTTRLPHGGISPTRIILDTTLRIPIETNVLQNNDAKTIIVCGSQANDEKIKQIESITHTQVWKLTDAKIDLSCLIDRLVKEKIMSVYVEGGATIHSSFIQERLFNEIHLYMAPILIGGANSKSFYNLLGFDEVKDAIPLSFKKVETIGPDLKIIATPQEEVE